MDAENRLIITLGDLQAGTDEQYGAIIFDIDRIAEREVPTEQEVLIQEMDRLHADVWSAFSSTKGKKLEVLLNRRPE